MTETFEYADRLARHYQPGMWIGSLRRAFGPIAELSIASNYNGNGHAAVPAPENTIESRPPHYLLAMWAPPPVDQPFLPRWPKKVSLVAPDPRAAIREMLQEIPFVDRLWLTEQAVDWALMADIVMLCEPGLAPYQFRGLREFIDSERQATLAAISVNYGGPDDMFEHFTRTQPDPARAAEPQHLAR